MQCSVLQLYLNKLFKNLPSVLLLLWRQYIYFFSSDCCQDFLFVFRLSAVCYEMCIKCLPKFFVLILYEVYRVFRLLWTDVFCKFWTILSPDFFQHSFPLSSFCLLVGLWLCIGETFSPPFSTFLILFSMFFIFPTNFSSNNLLSLLCPICC